MNKERDMQDNEDGILICASSEAPPPPDWMWQNCAGCGKKVGFNVGDTNVCGVPLCNECYIKRSDVPAGESETLEDPYSQPFMHSWMRED